MSTDSSRRVPGPVLEYLRRQPTLTIATASSTGVPRASTLTYASDDVVLYVWTHPGSTTARHIDENPVVSFAIGEYAQDWRAAQGIQGTGEATKVEGADEIERVAGLFRDKFPSVAGERSGDVSFFRIAPTELQFIGGEAGDGGEPQQLGIEYPRDVVYSVFGDLPREERETIRAQLERIEVKAGTVIVRQGAPADKFFIIAEGEVEVVSEEEHENRTLARLGPGEFFGELALLRDTRRTATVQAVAPTTLFAMERDALRSLVAQSLGTTDRFDEVIRERMYS
jgi:uncharacterized protein YhbP (UPF0306 family)